jgi:hypothetical protein
LPRPPSSNTRIHGGRAAQSRRFDPMPGNLPFSATLALFLLFTGTLLLSLAYH